MFKYKVNSRLLPQIRALAENETRGSFSIELSTHGEIHGSPGKGTFTLGEHELIKYPLFRNSSSRRKNDPLKDVRTDPKEYSDSKLDPKEATTPINKDKDEGIGTDSESELQINVELDFGWLFGWLERGIWLTMAIGVGWALAYDFSLATDEYCLPDRDRTDIKHFPSNYLPSLSRSMSSFRVGKFLWTITMAAVFVARLLSNHFLHRLYGLWYADTIFNKIFLGIAYILDTFEIITLIMIPAFSLDCDPKEHSFFFFVFISLTYAAELFQYFTKFLKRKKGFVVFSEDVNNYYKQIGILILLQTFFVGFMLTGYYLHDYLCGDFYYTIFTLGEYITVIINVRFKRDTVLFVK